MNPVQDAGWPDADSMVKAADALMAGMNEGLLIYLAESMEDPAKLRLLYANADASRFTGTDLSAVIGKKIGDAFPALIDTDLPQAFLDVVHSQKPVKIGAVEYEDEQLDKAYYSVKAFPMPNHCVGVIFENIGLRKQVDEMVRKLNETLKEQNTVLREVLREVQSTLAEVTPPGESSGKGGSKSGRSTEKFFEVSGKLSALISEHLNK